MQDDPPTEIVEYLAPGPVEDGSASEQNCEKTAEESDSEDEGELKECSIEEIDQRIVELKSGIYKLTLQLQFHEKVRTKKLFKIYSK